MAYLVQSWVKCSQFNGTAMHGEEQLRCIRVRHFSQVKPAVVSLRTDRGLCRITVTHSSQGTVWDLWRNDDRDQELDSSMRSMSALMGTIEVQPMDVAAGVTQKELQKAVEELVTQPGKLY